MTRPGLLTLAAGVLLAAWCVLGVAFTVERLASPVAGWRISRPAETRGSLGIPLQGADHVAPVRALLARADPSGARPWLVVLPPDADSEVVQYLRAQLAHLEYPRRVDVVRGGARPPRASYRGLVAAPGVTIRGVGRPAAAARGFAAFVLEAE